MITAFRTLSDKRPLRMGILCPPRIDPTPPYTYSQQLLMLFRFGEPSGFHNRCYPPPLLYSWRQSISIWSIFQPWSKRASLLLPNSKTAVHLVTLRSALATLTAAYVSCSESLIRVAFTSPFPRKRGVGFLVESGLMPFNILVWKPAEPIRNGCDSAPSRNQSFMSNISKNFLLRLGSSHIPACHISSKTAP